MAAECKTEAVSHRFWVQSPMATQVEIMESRRDRVLAARVVGRVVPGGQVGQAMSGRQLATSTSE
jgi:hypothetical protein